VLQAEQLECERAGRKLFRGLSLILEKGDLLRVAGANGSGKTSLLRILCGLLTPDGGEVRWQSSDIRGLREEYSKQLVFIGHATALKDELTAAENLAVTCALAGLRVDEEKVHGALQVFGLSGKDDLVKKLSQGQRRRAQLARLALSESIPLWLLDEPFAALDASAARLVEELIGRHVARGSIVVFTTHQETRMEGARVLDLGAG